MLLVASKKTMTGITHLSICIRCEWDEQDISIKIMIDQEGPDEWFIKLDFNHLQIGWLQID